MSLIHVATPDGQQAVHDEQEARALHASGALPPGSLYWMKGMGEWRPIEEFMRQPPRSNQEQRPAGLAIASIVLGISSLLFSLLTAIPAIICGHLALRNVGRSNGTIGGRGLAITGLVFGYIAVLLFALFMLIPFLGRTSDPARRSIDASNIRQIGQASLIYALDNEESLPPVFVSEEEGDRPTTIHDVALILANEGGINDADLWFSSYDEALSGKESEITSVSNRERTNLNPPFAAQQIFSFDYVTGLTTADPSTTPIAWTRGLREDGTWDENGVYGTDGGYIVFIGGHVSFYSDLGSGEFGALTGTDGERTSNILDALPPGTRIVGGGRRRSTEKRAWNPLPEATGFPAAGLSP